MHRKYDNNFKSMIVNLIVNEKHSTIRTAEQFEQEDEWNGLPISTPPYIICSKCRFDKCVPIDYKSKRGFHHKYKEN